jgi:hypothetical protein
MAQNRSFRARAVDVHKPLDLVRDLSLLDSTEGLPAREVVDNHAALDAENEKVRRRGRQLEIYCRTGLGWSGQD